MKALDLFCGAGGASMGLHRAGFEVVGVDIAPQKNYPFEFHQADALTFPLDGFDLIWASPVCKRYSSITRTAQSQHKHPDQIPEIRARLEASGVDYIIENVVGSPLKGITLCGAMFGLRTYRHRIFESNVLLMSPPHPKHITRVNKNGRRVVGDQFMSISGHFAGVELAQRIMGIDWMGGAGLSQAVPPVYSEYLARLILAH